MLKQNGKNNKGFSNGVSLKSKMAFLNNRRPTNRYNRSAKEGSFSKGKIRLFWQSIICLAILGIVIATFSWSGNLANKAQMVFRNYVIEDYGMKPVFGFVESVMAWGNSFEDPEEIPAAASISLPVDGQTADNQATKEGIWIDAKTGSPIRAAMSGKITGNGQTDAGYWFELDSGLGWSFKYSDCGELLINEGDQVEQSQVLGAVGENGNIYVQVFYENQAINPAEFFLGGK